MKDLRIPDRDADALVRGRAPQGRPELSALGSALAEYRTAALAGSTSPQPSAALVAWLGGTSSAPLRTSGVRTARSSAPKRIVGGLVGVGVGVKVLLGVALGAAAVTGAGVAHVLPGQAQHVFDSVVSTVVPHKDVVIDPAAPVVDGTKDSGPGSTGETRDAIEGDHGTAGGSAPATLAAAPVDSVVSGHNAKTESDSGKGDSGSGKPDKSGKGDSGSGKGDSGSGAGDAGSGKQDKSGKSDSGKSDK